MTRKLRHRGKTCNSIEKYDFDLEGFLFSRLHCVPKRLVYWVCTM